MKSRGKIVTFYSYKGGTGRSMALANVAWILACNGKRVLAVDWDLEAPGLHRYFSPYLADRELTSSEGIIDFAMKFTDAAVTRASANAEAETTADKDWHKAYANIMRYAISLNPERLKFKDGGTLDFIPAGRQGDSYATRVNSFDWVKFYERLGGARLLDLAQEQMREDYDYVLIDSRTGVVDTAGICTVAMPDILVVCFTLNNQSIEGALSVTRSVLEEVSQRGGRTISILPVPMRLEVAEKAKLDRRLLTAQEGFNAILGPELEKLMMQRERDRLAKLRGPEMLNDRIELPETKEATNPLLAVAKFFEDVGVQYVPFYAYEEIPAPFASAPNVLDPFLTALERLTGYITNDTVNKLKPLPEEERQAGLKEFEEPPKREVVLVKPTPRLGWWERRTNWAKAAIYTLGAALVGVVPFFMPSQPPIQDSFHLLQIFDPKAGPLVAATVSSDGQDCYSASANNVQRWNCSNGKPANSWPVRDIAGMVPAPQGAGVLVWTSEGEVVLLITGEQKETIISPTIFQARFVFWAGPKSIIVVGYEPYHSAASGSSGLSKSSKIVYMDLGSLNLDPLDLRLESLQGCAMATVGETTGERIKMACARSNALAIFYLFFHGKEIFRNKPFDFEINLAISTVSMSPDGTFVAVGHPSGSIDIYKSDTWQYTSSINIPVQSDPLVPNSPNPAVPGNVNSIAYSTDGKLLAAAGSNSFVGIWDTASWQLKKAIAHKGNVYSVAFSADGSRLITASADGSSQLWSLK